MKWQEISLFPLSLSFWQLIIEHLISLHWKFLFLVRMLFHWIQISLEEAKRSIDFLSLWFFFVEKIISLDNLFWNHFLFLWLKLIVLNVFLKSILIRKMFLWSFEEKSKIFFGKRKTNRRRWITFHFLNLFIQCFDASEEERKTMEFLRQYDCQTFLSHVMFHFHFVNFE